MRTRMSLIEAALQKQVPAGADNGAMYKLLL